MNTASPPYPTEPGIYPGIPFDQYLQIPAFSNSAASLLLHSPLRMRLGFSEDTESTSFGSAAHVSLLETSEFTQRYMEGPDERRNSNAWKKAEAAAIAKGKILLKPAEWLEAKQMNAAICMNSTAMKWLQGGRTELTILWRDKATKLLCKARIDSLSDDWAVDLKTCKNGTPDAISRSVWTYGYHRQQAHYTLGLRAHGIKARFRFLFVERQTLDVIPVMLDPLAVDAGQEQIDGLKRLYAECQKRDEWPGIANGQVLKIDLPTYAYTQLESAEL